MIRPRMVVVTIVLLAGICALLLASPMSIDRLVDHEAQLRAFQQQSPLVAYLVALLAYVAACFMPGTSGKALLVGWLFGFVWGTVLVNIASTLAALLGFWAARYWLQERINSRFHGLTKRVRGAVLRDGGFYLLTVRMIPVIPFTLVNPVMGVSPMGVRTFWWASQLGMLPANCVFAYAGASLPELRQLVQQGATSVLTPQLIIAIVLLATFPLLARLGLHVIRRVREELA